MNHILTGRFPFALNIYYNFQYKEGQSIIYEISEYRINSTLADKN